MSTPSYETFAVLQEMRKLVDAHGQAVLQATGGQKNALRETLTVLRKEDEGWWKYKIRAETLPLANWTTGPNGGTRNQLLTLLPNDKYRGPEMNRPSAPLSALQTPHTDAELTYRPDPCMEQRMEAWKREWGEEHNAEMAHDYNTRTDHGRLEPEWNTHKAELYKLRHPHQPTPDVRPVSRTDEVIERLYGRGRASEE